MIFLSADDKLCKMFVEQLYIHKFTYFKKVIFLTIEKKVPEKSAKTSLPWEILLAAAVRKTSLNSSKEDFATETFP